MTSLKLLQWRRGLEKADLQKSEERHCETEVCPGF